MLCVDVVHASIKQIEDNYTCEKTKIETRDRISGPLGVRFADFGWLLCWPICNSCMQQRVFLRESVRRFYVVQEIVHSAD